jgi:hypothetical protein
MHKVHHLIGDWNERTTRLCFPSGTDSHAHSDATDPRRSSMVQVSSTTLRQTIWECSRRPSFNDREQVTPKCSNRRSCAIAEGTTLDRPTMQMSRHENARRVPLSAAEWRSYLAPRLSSAAGQCRTKLGSALAGRPWNFRGSCRCGRPPVAHAEHFLLHTAKCYEKAKAAGEKPTASAAYWPLTCTSGMPWYGSPVRFGGAS